MSILAKINRRRKQILVHSCIYYRFNENLITDFQYDAWGRELAKLQIDYPNESKQADYYEAFKDYTPECVSGFNLPIHDPNIVNKAEQLLQIHLRIDELKKADLSIPKQTAQSKPIKRVRRGLLGEIIS